MNNFHSSRNFNLVSSFKSKTNKNPFEILQNFLSKFQITNLSAFILYLSQVWRDLSSRSPDKSKGISRISFSHYYPLPGLISIRLFNIFDKNKDDYLSPQEFIEGMTVLFSESLEVLIHFIFLFYDFDNDGLIKKEDIKIILEYVPVPSDFNGMVKVENELYKMLKQAFGDKSTLDYNSFYRSILVNETFGLFIPIVIFLYEKKPFAVEIEDIYKNFIPNEEEKKYSIKGCVSVEESENNFANIQENNEVENEIDYKKRMKYHRKISSCQNLGEIASEVINRKPSKRKTSQLPTLCEKKVYELLTNPAFEQLYRSVPCLFRSSTIYKKVPISFQNYFNNTNDPAVANNSSQRSNQNSGSNSSGYDDEYDGIKYNNAIEKPVNTNGTILIESYLYKVTSSSHKVKKMYFKLINKDLFYYKSENSLRHKGMHNLSGVFFEYDNSGEMVINETKYYSFSIIYPSHRSHNYYTDSYATIMKWIKGLNKLFNIKEITDLYEIKETIGKGKFSVVNLGIDKKTHKKYAIKTINKKNLCVSDLELIKVEIDILKVCQHPYILKLYDVIETLSTIFIITEYCPGGNLFSYFEKRKFYFSEKKIVDIIHKISTAVYSMHNLGIIHRDLKLSNIVMTDSTDGSDIRILDFGLSKILGPGEKCTESYGTVGYAAPEVIKENKYDYKADIWSIGVITYFLFSGKLPFDYVSNNKKGKVDIIYNTLHDEIKFDNCERWKTISPEGICFIKELLNKDPEKRLNIKEVLEHKWIKKYYEDVIDRRKSSTNGSGYPNNIESVFKMYATINGDSKG